MDETARGPKHGPGRFPFSRTARVAAPDRAGRRRRALARARSRGAIDAVLRELPREELFALAAGAGAAERRRILRHARDDRAVRLPLGGDELLAFGLSGPALGRALAALRRAFLDGAWREPEEGLAWLRARGR